MGITFALLSAIFQGFGYVSLKKSYRRLKPSVGFALDCLWGLLIWITYAVITGIDFNKVLQVLPYAFLSGILSEAFVFFALSKGEISLTGSLFATYPIYTILFSRFINHESLSIIQWVTILLVIIGTVLVTLPSRIRKADRKKLSYLIWPILAAITVGVSDSFSKHIINQTDAATFLFSLAIAQIPVALGYLFIEYRRRPINLMRLVIKMYNQPSIYRHAFIGSICNVLCVLFLWISFGSTLATIASPLTATYPLYIVIFAKLLLNEKVSPQQWPGITLILENTFLLTLYTTPLK